MHMRIQFVLAAAAIAFVQPARAESVCWSVFLSDQPPAASDTADETVCMTSDTEGVVKDSSMFGSGVQGCSKVTGAQAGVGASLVVDFSKCTNDAPSHKIDCVQLRPLSKCNWTFTSGQHAGEASHAYVRRND